PPIPVMPKRLLHDLEIGFDVRVVLAGPAWTNLALESFDPRAELGLERLVLRLLLLLGQLGVVLLAPLDQRGILVEVADEGGAGLGAVGLVGLDVAADPL